MDARELAVAQTNNEAANNPGDVEVYFPDDDAWYPSLWYSPGVTAGRISFESPDDIDNPQSPFRRALVNIALQLDAKVVGDSGETYT